HRAGLRGDRGGNQFDGVARADDSRFQHFRVDAAPTREEVLVHAVEIATSEPRLVCLARRGVARDFEDDTVSEAEASTGDDQGPIDAAGGDVLAGAARTDGV